MFTEKQLKLEVASSLIQAFIAVLVAVVITSIIGNKIRQDSDAMRQKAALTHLLENRSAAAAGLKEKLAPLGDIDAQIESAFPTTDNVLDFVSAMESLAQSAKITQTLHFEAPTPFDSDEALSLSAMDYNATLTGEINPLINYLKGFENLPFFTQISSISITSGSGWQAETTIHLVAKLYIRNK